MVRVKERYLLVNIIYPPEISKSAGARVPSQVILHQPTVDQLTPQILVIAIKHEVASLFGDYGSGAVEKNLSVKYLSLATSTIILRCSRDHYQMLWSALTFMDHVPTKDGTGKPCIFRVVRVSGTIRKVEEEAIRQAKRLIIAANNEATMTADSRMGVTAVAARLPPEPALNVTDDMSDVSMDDDDG